MRAHSAIFPLYLVSRQGKYLYTVHEFTKLTQLQAIHWTILVSFVQGILYYRGKASRVYQICSPPKKNFIRVKKRGAFPGIRRVGFSPRGILIVLFLLCPGCACFPWPPQRGTQIRKHRLPLRSPQVRNSDPRLALTYAHMHHFGRHLPSLQISVHILGHSGQTLPIAFEQGCFRAFARSISSRNDGNWAA